MKEQEIQSMVEEAQRLESERTVEVNFFRSGEDRMRTELDAKAQEIRALEAEKLKLIAVIVRAERGKRHEGAGRGRGRRTRTRTRTMGIEGF
eukprot:758969-Hanusia_phi.AAC.3